MYTEAEPETGGSKDPSGDGPDRSEKRIHRASFMCESHVDFDRGPYPAQRQQKWVFRARIISIHYLHLIIAYDILHTENPDIQVFLQIRNGAADGPRANQRRIDI